MKIAVIGQGRMGSLLKEEAKRRGHDVVMGDCLDPDRVLAAREDLDLIIDFSHPNNLDFILEQAANPSTALVLGTTGYTDEQLERIEDEAQTRPVFFSSNYSLGVAVLKDLAARAAAILDSWDKEIVELHHSQKADAPSGTALSLLEAIDPQNEYEHVFGRHGKPGPRKKEIGIHALRGGSAAGDHEILFLGDQEIIRISHSAQNRQIFVNGALDAAEFMENKPAGLYSMKELIGDRS